MFACAFVFAMLRGLSPLWYFQGIERVRGAVAVDSASKIGAALGVLLLVRSPEDGWRVLALQAAFAGVSTALLTARMAREVRLLAPTFHSAIATLQRSGRVFAVRAASGLFIQGNTLILAGLASPLAVSFFGGAERIVRASINLLQPLTQAILPRISFLSVADPVHGRRTIERCLLVVGGIGAAFAVVTFAGAPVLTRVLLGPGYEGAVPVMRVLAMLPLLVAIDTVLGVFWALPFGHERDFLGAVVAAGITNIGLALALVPRLGALGMGVAVVLAEAVILLWLSSLYLRRRAPARLADA
jgi:PST family polysaccharide transporter